MTLTSKPKFFVLLTSTIRCILRAAKWSTVFPPSFLGWSTTRGASLRCFNPTLVTLWTVGRGASIVERLARRLFASAVEIDLCVE